MTKTQELLTQLSSHIDQLAIAGYLKEEALASLKYLHRYKLKNIEKNLDSFCEYLLFLNTQNTDKILELGSLPSPGKKSITHELSYFLLPHKKMSKREQTAAHKKITDHGYELLTLIQGIKGILVLSIDEFCNASATRMSIHQMLMQKETQQLKTHSSKKKKTSK